MGIAQFFRELCGVPLVVVEQPGGRGTPANKADFTGGRAVWRRLSGLPQRDIAQRPMGSDRIVVAGVGLHDVIVMLENETQRFRPGTLTLRNKYEASDAWFDLEKDTVWKTTPRTR